MRFPTTLAISIVLFLFKPCLYGQEIISRSAAISKQLEVLRSVDNSLLELLPDTFEEYMSLWGELDSPLYDKPSVVEHLLHSEWIDYAKYVHQVVGISVGAFPGVDHVYSLQYVVRTLLKTHLRLVVECLNQRSFTENVQFWSFVFGGIEERATIEYMREIKTRIQKLKRFDFTGYQFEKSLDSGYERSAKYLLKH